MLFFFFDLHVLRSALFFVQEERESSVAAGSFDSTDSQAILSESQQPCQTNDVPPSSSSNLATTSSAAASSRHASSRQRPWHDGLHSVNHRSPNRRRPSSSSLSSSHPSSHIQSKPWRVTDRVKTRNGLLVLCLKIGVDPPDIVKPNPCARMECWQHPNPDHVNKSIQSIATSLKGQYERWGERDSRLKTAPDPTLNELKRLCMALRRAAGDQRVLFHYNGHGVPRPTANGEIWVFNPSYSQYIPFNVFDLQEILGNPVLYIFDCNSAGTVLYHYQRYFDQCDRDWQESRRRSARPSMAPSHHHSVFLAACADSQILPMTPHVPADLFTSCLTTPIKTALRWFIRRSLVCNITIAMLDRIPGKPNVRGTPLGELEYVFTAVTDSIAWNVLPRELFKKLYRQDLLLASMMRNFLLAQRIMRSYGCDAICFPEIPQTHNHPLWQSFDIAMEHLFSQLPAMLAAEDAYRRAHAAANNAQAEASSRLHSRPNSLPPTDPRSSGLRYSLSRGQAPKASLHDDVSSHAGAEHPPPYSYRSCSFFADQMKAFDVWLAMGPEFRDPPIQLPVLLQVLLSQTMRAQALHLISRYMQTGPVAVDEALAVGIYPYMSKLLRDAVPEIHDDLVFIWSKILALDDSCRSDIVKDQADEFFVRYLLYDKAQTKRPDAVYLASAMFVISVVARKYAERCHGIGGVDACVIHLCHEKSFVRRWACLCLTEILQKVKLATQLDALGRADLVDMLRCCVVEDRAPDVRAAAVSSLAAIMNGVLRDMPDDRDADSRTAGTATSGMDFHEGPILLGSVRSSSHPGAGTSPAERLEAQAPSGTSPTDFNPISRNPSNIINENELLDAVVTPYSNREIEALLKIGRLIALVARKESSVLVRREVAIAIASMVTIQEERFIRAGLISEIGGGRFEDVCNEETDTRSVECENVYRSLWVALSELAFDPHPVVAALARRSYDKICDVVVERTAPYTHQGDIPVTDDVFSSRSGSPVADFVLPSSKSTDTHEVEMSSAVTPDGTATAPIHELPSMESTEVQSSPLDRLGEDSDDVSNALKHSQRSSPCDPTPIEDKRTDNATQRLGSDTALSGTPPRFVRDSIRVRSDSGWFDLNVSTRPTLQPNVGSLTVFPSSVEDYGSSCLALAAQQSSEEPEDDALSEPGDRVEVEIEQAHPSPQMHIAHRIRNFMRTCSQHLPVRWPVGHSNPSHLPKSTSSSSGLAVDRMGRNDEEVRAVSPPRPPTRSMSYQVLNAASSFSPKKETPLFPPSKPTTYFPVAVGMGGVAGRTNRYSDGIPHGYSRLFKSENGNAALTIYEWSAAYISRADVEGFSADDVHEEETIPQHSALLSNIAMNDQKSNADIFRVFALLKKGDEMLSREEAKEEGGEDHASGDDYKKEFVTAFELSMYVMGAGGGSISALTFLPRNIGIGEDQFVATGDTHGSVGVYDARTGKCQGAFGIPDPPGVREEGVSSIMCLNPSRTEDASSSRASSNSALILAGSYDGRVAVFKNDFSRRNDFCIMSTFQASGRTICGKILPSRTSAASDNQSAAVTIDSSWYVDQKSSSYADILKKQGKGLVLAFKAQSANLVAGGLDSEIVKVWDLSCERCIWEGRTVARGSWPTALSMWKSGDQNIFVVGSSDGSVNVVDIREKSTMKGVLNLGRQEEPIMSIGTCPPEGANRYGDVVVSADYGAEIVFWDARWGSNESGLNRADSLDVRRIAAHGSNLTAMSVHRNGRYIASGSLNGVKIFGRDREMMKMISHHEGAFEDGGVKVADGDRLAAVTSLTFQHESSLLAVGCLDGSVMIYGQHRDLFPGIR